LLQGVELFFLVLIWLDGRVMKASALRSEELYKAWFDERRTDRATRQAAAQKAREAKAAKASAILVPLAESEVVSIPFVDGPAGKRRTEDIPAAGND
jgi:hypothetical protein